MGKFRVEIHIVFDFIILGIIKGFARQMTFEASEA